MKVSKEIPFKVNDRIVEMVKADNQLIEQLTKQKKASHKALWAAVHEEYPELKIEYNYTLNCEYAEQGIVMIDKVRHNPKNNLSRTLNRLIKVLD